MRLRQADQTTEGTGGAKVDIVANFFRVARLPNFTGLHQYNVSFDPDIQSGRLKSALLHNLDDILGTVHCFDGMTMFLPKKLPDQETVRTVTTRTGNDITVKVTYTNLVPQNSPSVVQLMNILFKK